MSMVSVCMATYNGEKYIKQQLTSILSQLDEKDEIVISDDSSSDNTIQIIKEFGDKRIRLLSDNKYRNPVFNIENALRHAIGDYIFLSDQDDVWLPNKLKLVLEHLVVKKKLVFHNAVITDSNLKADKKLSEWRTYHNGFWKNLIRPFYIGCCMAFPSELLVTALPFPKNTVAHDVWLGLLSEAKSGVFFIEEPLLLYRRHELNYSFAGNKSQNSISYMLSYRLKLLYNIFNRLR